MTSIYEQIQRSRENDHKRQVVKRFKTLAEARQFLLQANTHYPMTVVPIRSPISTEGYYNHASAIPMATTGYALVTTDHVALETNHDVDTIINQRAARLPREVEKAAGAYREFQRTNHPQPGALPRITRAEARDAAQRLIAAEEELELAWQRATKAEFSHRWTRYAQDNTVKCSRCGRTNETLDACGPTGQST